MPTVAKKKPASDEQPPDRRGKGKRYPSRENLRYVAIPKDLHEELERYAEENSDEDDKKSISWAARKAIRKFLVDEGRWPPRGKGA